MNNKEKPASFIVGLYDKVPALPVPTLPLGFATEGWYLNPNLLFSNLPPEQEQELLKHPFQMRIQYAHGDKQMHTTIKMGGPNIDPQRCKDKVYALVSDAVVKIRKTLLIVN